MRFAEVHRRGNGPQRPGGKKDDESARDRSSQRSRSQRGATAVPSAGASEREVSPASEVPPNPLQDPPPPQSDSTEELRPEGAQEVDEKMGEGSERVILSPAQSQELLDVRFNVSVAEAVPKLAKGMVTMRTEGLAEQVSALTTAHGKTDQKLSWRASAQ